MSALLENDSDVERFGKWIGQNILYTTMIRRLREYPMIPRIHIVIDSAPLASPVPILHAAAPMETRAQFVRAPAPPNPPLHPALFGCKRPTLAECKQPAPPDRLI